jgi:hypothetical protein
MASVTSNKRTSESKFVTIFGDGSDGSQDVDISFREPLLGRPSDHFMVGVDNLTVNLNNLSMLQSNDKTIRDDFVIQVGRFSGTPNTTLLDLDVDAGLLVELLGCGSAYVFPESYKYRVTANMQSIQQLAFDLNIFFQRINDDFIANGVNNAIVLGGTDTVQGANHASRKIGVDTGDGLDNAVQVHADITGGGKLRIMGTRIFWAAHFIRILKRQDMYMIDGRRRTTVDAAVPPVSYDESQFAFTTEGTNVMCGDKVVDTYRIFQRFSTDGTLCSLNHPPGTAGVNHPSYPSFFPTVGNAAAIAATLARLLATAHTDNTGAGAAPHAVNLPFRNEYKTFVFGANLLSTADRRVAIELQCSLPIINNPLVDHGQESADTVIGRWMMNPMVRIKTTTTGTSMTFESSAPDVYELQSGLDRVQYHSLMPQDKIHFVRLKMYARIREYSETRDRYDMITVAYPMRKEDWWHARLHFVSKD